MDIPAASGSATFYFQGTLVGNPIPLTVSRVSGDALLQAVQNEVITFGIPTQLTFVSSASTLVAGNCSGKVQFKAVDTWGNTVIPASDATVTLAGSDGATSFYKQAGCAPADLVTEATIAASAPALGEFYFSSTKSGTTTLSLLATVVGPDSVPRVISGSQNQTINHAAADSLAFTTNPANVVAGQSFASAVKVTVLDAFANIVTDYASAIGIDIDTNPPGDGAIVGGAKSQMPASGVATFTAASDIVIQKIGTGYTLKATSGSLQKVSAAFNVLPAAPQKYRITSAAPAAITAGYCSGAQVTLQFEDTFGNISPLQANTSVAFTRTPSGTGAIQYYTDSNCTTVAPTTINSGTSTVSYYYKGKIAGTNTLAAAVSGITCDASLGCTPNNTQTFTINPDLAYALKWTTSPIVAPFEVEAGACSPKLTLQTQDQYGNASAVGASQDVTLTPSSGKFYSDAACTTEVVNPLVISAGDTNADLYFSTTTAAGGVLTAIAQADFSGTFAEGAVTPHTSSVSQSHALKAAPPDHFAITQQPLQSIAGQTLAGPFTVEMRDRFENFITSNFVAYVNIDTFNPAPLPVLYGGAATTSMLTPGGSYFPGTPIQSLRASASAGELKYTGTKGINIQKVGTYTLRLSALGVDFKPSALTASFDVINAPASKLVFTTSPHTRVAGVCSGNVTIQSQDPYSNIAAVLVNTTLTPSGTGMTFYSDSGCTTPLTTVDIVAGTSAATFYFKGTVASAAQTLTVQATAGESLTQATQNQIINPDVPHHLVYTTPARSTTAGVCSSAITLQSQDQFNNPSPVSGSTSVNLGAVSTPVGATLTFFSDASCTTSIGTTATINNASSSVTLYAKGTVVGSTEITATPAFNAAGFIAQTETVVAAALNKIVYLQNENQTLTAGDCSAEAIIELQDAYNNAVKGSPTTVSFAPSDTGMTFYSDSGCSSVLSSGLSIGTGTSQGSFWFKSTVAGNPRKIVTSVGAVTKTANQGINPAGFSKFAFTNGTTQLTTLTVTAGACQALTVQAQDAFGNFLASNLVSQRVVLDDPSGTTLFFSASDCSGGSALPVLPGGDANYPNKPYLTIANDTKASFYFKNIVKGAYNPTAVDTGITFNAPFALTVNAASPHHLAFAPAPSTSIAGQPLAPAPVKVSILDLYENVTTSTASVTLAMDGSNPNNSGATLAGTVTASAVAGAASFSTVNITKAGVGYTLKATSAGLPDLISTGFDVTAAAPSKLAISSPSHSVVAGVCSPATTVTITDTYGNPATYASNLAIDLSGTGLTFFTDASCSTTAGSQITVPAGQSSANFYFLPTTSGSISLDVSRTVAPVLTGASQNQTIAAAAASKIAFSTPARTDITAGVCSGTGKIITIELQDTYGNRATNTSGSAYALDFADLSATSAKLYTDNGCSSELGKSGGNYQASIANGGSSFDFFVSDNKAENLALSVTVASEAWSAAQQTETILPATPVKLAFVTAPVTNLVAGVCSSLVTFQSQDAFDNASGGTAKTVTLSSDASVNFYSDAGCSSTIPGSTLNLAVGAHTQNFYFRSTQSGNHNIQISTGGLTSATQTETVTFAAVTKLGFKVQPSNTTAGQAITPAVVVEARDTYGNLVSNYAGTIDIDKDAVPAGGTLSGTVSIATTNGTATFNDLSIELKGTGYKLNATSAGLTSVQSNGFNILSAAPHSLYFVSAAQALDVKNCSAVTTVGVKDTFDNITTVSSATTVQLTGADISYFSDSACSVPITQATIAAGQGQTQFWFKATKAGNKSVTVQSAGLVSASQVETIAPAVPTRIAITSAPQTVRSGECSGALDIETQDVDGNTSPALTAVFISAFGSNFTFWADSACTTPATTILIGAGTTNTQLYFKGALTGNSTILLTAVGMSPSPTQAQTIVPGFGTKLRFASAAQNLLTQECSALTNFRVYDINDNETEVVAPVDVDLTPTGGVTFYSDSGCSSQITKTTINPSTPVAGVSEGGFYFKTSTVTGKVNTKVEVYSTTSTDADRFKNPWSSDTLIHDVSPRPPEKISMLGTGQNVRVNSCFSAITLETRDSFDNKSPVASTVSIALSADFPVQYFSDASCLTPLSAATLSLSGGASNASFYIKSTEANTVRITATTDLGNGSVSDFDDFVIEPGSGATLLLSKAPPVAPTPAILKVDECLGLYEVKLKDKFGNVTKADYDYPLVLSSVFASYYNDSACTDEILPLYPAKDRVVTFKQGDSVLGPIYMKTTQVGIDNTVFSSYSGLENAVHQFQIVPNVPKKLSFVTNGLNIPAGVCSGAITITSQDLQNNEAYPTVPLNLTITLDQLGQQYLDSNDLGLYSDKDCTIPVSSPAITPPESRYTFYLKSNKMGVFTTTVSSGALEPARQGHTVQANSPLNFIYTFMPSTLLKDACSMFSGYFVDAFGNRVSPMTGTISVGANKSVLYYSDNGCTQAIIDNSAIPSEPDGTVTYYMTAADLGTMTLTTSTGITGSTNVVSAVDVVNSNLSQVKFTSLPNRVGLKFCSPPVNIQLRDPSNNPLNVTGTALDVRLFGLSTEFFTSADCTGQSVSKVTIPVGSNSATFRYKVNPNRALKKNTNVISLNVTEPGMVGSIQTYELLFLENAIPDGIAPVLGQGLLLGQCTYMPASYKPALYDYPLDVTITPSANLEVFSDSGCSSQVTGPLNVPATAGATMDFWVKATTAGNASLTFSEPHLNSGNLNTIVKDRRLTLNKSSLMVGVCTAFDLESRSYAGALLPTDSNLDVAVSFATTSGAFPISAYSDATCTTGISKTTIAAGQSSKTIYFLNYVSPSSGNFIAATNDSRYFNLTQGISTTPAPPAKLAISDPLFDSIPVDACSPALTFYANDTYGNRVAVALETTVNLTAQNLDAYGVPAGTTYSGVQFYSNSDCTGPITSVNIGAGSNKTANFYFKASTSGIFGIVGNASFGSGFTKMTSSAEKMAVVVSPNAPTKEVYQCRPFKVQHQNISSGLPVDPVAPVEITVKVPSPTYSDYALYRTPDCSGSSLYTIVDKIVPLPGSPTPGEIEANSSRIYYVRSKTLESFPLTVSAPGRVSTTLSVESIVPADAKLLFAEGLPAVEAGVCSGDWKYVSRSRGQTTYLAALNGSLVTSDATGNREIYGSSTTKMDLSSQTMSFYADPFCMNPITEISIVAGTSSTPQFFFESTKAGPNELSGLGQVTSNIGGVFGRSIKQIHASTVAQIGFGSDPQTVRATQCSNDLILQVQDQYGNEQVDQFANEVSFNYPSGFTLYSDNTCSTSIATTIIPANQSRKTIWFKHNTAENATVRPLPVRPLSGIPQTQKILSGTAASLAFANSPITVPKGSCSARATIQIVDAGNNPVNAPSDVTVSLLGEPGAGLSFYSDASCSTVSQVNSITIPQGSGSAGFYFIAHRQGQNQITVKNQDMVDAKQYQTVTAGLPVKLAFSSGTQSILAGTCSQALKVNVLDSYNDQSAASGNTTLSLAGDGVTFYSDKNCAIPVTNLSLSTGDQSKTFYLKSTTPGSVSVSVTDTTLGNLTPAFQAVNILPAAMSLVAFTTPSATVQVGRCSPATTLGLFDKYGNTVTANKINTVLLNLSGTDFSFYVDDKCTTGVVGNQLVIGNGDSSATFYFKSPTIGSRSISVANNRNLDPTSQLQTFVSGVPDRLGFATPVATIGAGGCSQAITVTTRDLSDNETNAGHDYTINLSASGGAQFYSAAGCTVGSEITSATIVKDSSRVDVYLKAPGTTGTGTLTVSEASLTSATQNYNVVGGAPAALAFTSAAQSGVVIDTCSALVSFGLKDAFGNNTKSVGMTTVSLSSAGATFFSDAACLSSVSSVTVANNQSAGSFYFKPSQVGTIAIQLSASGLTSATQNQTGGAGAASKLVFASAPKTLVAGTCETATLETQDSNGNATSSTSARSIALAYSGSAVTFYSTLDCSATAVTSVTLPANDSSTQFSYRITAVGSSNITGTSSGLAQALQTETIVADTPVKLAFVTSPRTITAGGCSSNLVIQSQDTYGNPSTLGSTKTLTLAGADLTFYSGAGCTTPISTIDIASGTHSATFYFKSTVASSPVLNITTTGLTAASQTQTVNNDVPNKLAFLNAPLSLVAGSCGLMNMQLQDQYGNPASVGSAKTITYQLSGVTSAIYSDSGCTSTITTQSLSSGNSFSAYFKSSVAGMATVRISTPGINYADQTQTIAAGANDHIAFATAPLTVSVSQCSGEVGPITLQVQDALGNPSALGTGKSFTLSGIGITFYSDVGCTTSTTTFPISAGAHSANIYFKTSTAGSPTLTAAMTGFTSVNQSQTVNPLAATKLAMTTPTQTIATTACAAVSIQTQDAFGNAISRAQNTTVNLNVTSGTLSVYSDSGCSTATSSVTITSGSSTAPNIYVKSNVAGTAILTASDADAILTSGSQTITLTAGTATKIAFTTAAQTLVANTCSGIVKVETQDSNSNPTKPAASKTINLTSTPTATPATSGLRFYTDSACSSEVTSVTIGTAAQEASFYVKAIASNTYTITANTAGFSSITQTETVNPGTITKLTVTSGGAQPALNAGTCSAGVVIQTFDAVDNASPALGTMNFNLTGTNLSFFSNSSCSTPITQATIATGTSSTTFYYKATVLGSYTINITGAFSNTATTTIIPGAPHVLKITAPITSIHKDTCSGAFTVRSLDDYNNYSNVSGAQTVTLQKTPSGIQLYSDFGCVTPLASDQVTIANGTSTSNSFYYKHTTAEATSVTAHIAGFVDDTVNISVNNTGPMIQLYDAVTSTLVGSGSSYPFGLDVVDTSKSFQLKNDGTTVTGSLTVQLVEDLLNPAGGSATMWTLLTDQCSGNTLNPGATCLITVRFNAQTGNKPPGDYYYSNLRIKAAPKSDGDGTIDVQITGIKQ